MFRVPELLPVPEKPPPALALIGSGSNSGGYEPPSESKTLPVSRTGQGLPDTKGSSRTSVALTGESKEIAARDSGTAPEIAAKYVEDPEHWLETTAKRSGDNPPVIGKVAITTTLSKHYCYRTYRSLGRCKKTTPECSGVIEAASRARTT